MEKILRLFLGKEVALALGILRVLSKVLKDIPNPEQKAIGDLTRLVFNQLPEGIKAPKGPLTEIELLTVIKTALPFGLALHQAFTK